jgi:acetyltransferase-like isoleucine patch superfamily enzyme
MLGAMGVATRDIPAGEVALGIPAKSRAKKPPIDERPKQPRTVDPFAEPDA